MSGNTNEATDTAPAKGAPEHVAYVTKQITTKDLPDSIEYGKTGARVKVYGNLGTIEGSNLMGEKLGHALEMIKEADEQAGE